MTEDDPRGAGRRAAHGQAAYAVRLETGPAGAAAVVAGLGAEDVAVVVDVLSFTTTVTLAVERGVEVHPFAWRDARAEAYARERDAVLAVGRFEAAASSPGVEERASRDRPTLSPAAMLRGDGLAGVRRLVLPSPNGSTISALLADAGVGVVGACLRNARAVADALAPALLRGSTLAVVASGERWGDGSLRPAAEDVWGAGALLAVLLDRGVTGLSPEAGLAVAAWRAVADDPAAALHACAGGRELAAAGFGEDVDVAAAVDVSDAVPVLLDGAFRGGRRWGWSAEGGSGPERWFDPTSVWRSPPPPPPPRTGPLGVRVMVDDHTGIWCWTDDDSFTEEDLDRDDAPPVPPGLRARLRAWTEEHEAHLGAAVEPGWPADHDRRGRAMAAELQESLGEDYRVEHVPGWALEEGQE